MPIIRLQGEVERQHKVYYEFDSSDTPLGVGGMGKVYRGKSYSELTGVSRDVAIKFLYDDVPEHVVARARREASIQLRNDNLVEMLGFIEIDAKDVTGQVAKRYHVVSELLDGVSLDELLRGNVTGHDGLVVPYAEQLYRQYKTEPYKFAIYLIRNILSGIMALHDAGYIHRDIDPSNIMVTRDGHIKLIDFGIAKRVDTLNTNDKSFTTAGQFMGKAQYAAPELVLGDIGHQSYTTDIYAIGIILFQFITGHLPFDGALHEVLDMQLHKKIPLHQLQQRAIRNVVAKATAKKQIARYQSAAEFRVAVDSLMVLPYPDSMRRKSIMMVAGIAIAAIIVSGVLFLLHNNRSTNKWPIESPSADVINDAVTPSATVTDSIEIDTAHTKRVEQEPVREELPAMATYQTAKALLAASDALSIRQGFEMLVSLADSGDYQAIFTLSRLYFTRRNTTDKQFYDKNMVELQRALKIEYDNRKAHDLLVKAVTIKDNDYHSLFELGCDYMSGTDRGCVRNTALAKQYFNKARELALNSNNADKTKYVTNIDNMLGRIR